MTAKPSKAMMILIAGAYRSGTNDDPALIKKNVETMESFALPIFRAGHIPILGEWLALPLVALGGSKKLGDEVFNEVFHPIATRLLEKCDAVLRVGGPSAGADEMVRVGRTLGLKIYTTPAEIPKTA
ncbi:MAG: DUF4406 domain-containing protein [Terriglobales bacterium]